MLRVGGHSCRLLRRRWGGRHLQHQRAGEPVRVTQMAQRQVMLGAGLGPIKGHVEMALGLQVVDLLVVRTGSRDQQATG
jgi:hypothetical protein